MEEYPFNYASLQQLFTSNNIVPQVISGVGYSNQLDYRASFSPGSILSSGFEILTPSYPSSKEKFSEYSKEDFKSMGREPLAKELLKGVGVIISKEEIKNRVNEYARNIC